MTNNNNIWNTKVFNILEKRKYYDIIPENILNITYFDLLYMTDNEIERLSNKNESILLEDSNWYDNKNIKNIIIFNSIVLQNFSETFIRNFDKIKILDAIDLLIYLKKVLVFVKNNKN